MPPTLWDLNEKEHASIHEIDQSLRPDLIIRLREIGLDDKREVECLKKLPFGGPKIFQLGDSVFSLEKEVAAKVFITKNEKKRD